MTTQNIDTLIAFDTIFGQCSIAILRGADVVYINTVESTRGQTQIILPMLDDALKTSNISLKEVKAWAFNRGPGAFSGIRINTSVVQALSFANGACCVGVSSLEALAYCIHVKQNFKDGTTITAVIDARQEQVYVGDFVINNRQVVPIMKSKQSHEYLADYQSLVHSDVVVGDGVTLIQTAADQFDIKPDASHIAKIAQAVFLTQGGVSAQNALPVYLRNNAWKTLAEQGKK